VKCPFKQSPDPVVAMRGPTSKGKEGEVNRGKRREGIPVATIFSRVLDY